MAKAPARTPTFSRGSTVLDYWLAHAEGMTVQPLGARVEEVVVTPRVGHAEALIVRSRVTRRRTSIPAEAIVAVEPSAGELLLDAPPRVPRTRVILAWLQPRAVAAGRAGKARSSQGAAWLAPRARAVAPTSVAAVRACAARTAQGAAWLAPRAGAVARTSAAAAMRWTLAAAVLTAHGIAVAAERARASLEARRAR
jgi:hypothetical protein